MGKAWTKLKRVAGNTVKRPKPRKVQSITRTEARRRAERHVLDRMFKGATVQDGAEVRLYLGYRPNPRTAASWSKDDVWVVYKNPKEIALKSADVILVCKRTGRVLYEGSAGGEG